ncbi:MAG: hypothetical protein A3I68_05530 [Candidatus Melainabacteria bacterium RIFCSPLOWO2_02_FULL_35_15]|nr:MAG: hypothetical protein A3F80_07840 [Candidatus Melainabacteria bacterium RIFCSPLOWO2_12_FULL_35_11]OGI12905.1 MAG: hypothetical protein A3I68_05530 [Candidatus Melainabacteria bacterium RIFCSPLOWO2_02_FULL_35_15]
MVKEQNKKYESAYAFRRALEDRLNNLSKKEGIALDRLRKKIAFDRLLARLFKNKQNKWLLKGGYALELYLRDIARTTKDIDLSIPEKKKINKEKIRELLQEEAEKDIKDYFQFLIGASYQDLHQPVYGGWRYPVEAKLDNRTFTKFHLDVGIGDEIISKPIWQKGHNLLNFAGILPAKVAVIPREQQFAEKIHSYTFPKDKRNNSRVKDLLDLVLLIQHCKLRKAILKQSIEKTFQNRGTHHLPEKLESPPADWGKVYEKLADECKSSKGNTDEAFRYLDKYWEKLYKFW